MKKLYIVAMMVIAGVVGVAAQPLLNHNNGPLQLELTAEGGFFKVFLHTIQIGDPGTEFDYVNEGGQEILFPFYRYTGELSLKARHSLIFLYQPLEIVRQIRFQDEVIIDGVSFAEIEDEGVTITYGFPFYRLSYLYDFARSPNLELAAGLSLQLRNATLKFVSTDGEDIVVTQDLGPVPILKVRGTYRARRSKVPGACVSLEADGFYASSKFFNGAEYPFTGSIFDASIRAGFSPRPALDVFINMRALGGGATGTRPPEAITMWSQSRDGYTDNFLVSGALTLGARVR